MDGSVEEIIGPVLDGWSSQGRILRTELNKSFALITRAKRSPSWADPRVRSGETAARTSF